MSAVSIAMPCFEQAAFVEEAVRSVLDQEGVEKELLVLDPGSQDGSRAVLERLRGEYGARLVLCFEPDAGQADAVNRGLARARHECLGWLNSDDRLRPGALARAAAALDPAREAWCYGAAGMIDARGGPTTAFIARYKRWRGRSFSRFKLLTENFIPQMSVFWTRKLWQRAGGLDVARHLDMDYDLWLRFAEITPPAVIDAELADFRVHGAAKGSTRTSEQLACALQTARAHARGLSGACAIALHRVLGWRTRVCYWFVKPPTATARRGGVAAR